MHRTASTSSYTISQFHTAVFQEHAFSLAASDLKIVEKHLCCVQSPNFHIREECHHSAVVTARNERKNAMEILENHLSSSSACCAITHQANHCSVVHSLITRRGFCLSIKRYGCTGILVAVPPHPSSFPF